MVHHGMIFEIVREKFSFHAIINHRFQFKKKNKNVEITTDEKGYCKRLLKKKQKVSTNENIVIKNY